MSATVATLPRSQPEPAEPPQLPHDDRLELALLGAIMADPDQVALHSIAGLIQPSDFYDVAHGWIFEACLRVRERGQGVDKLTVAADLAATGRLADVGGHEELDYIVSLPEAYTSVLVQDYARIIAEHALRRRLMALAADLTEDAFARGDPGEILVKLEAGLDKLREAAAMLGGPADVPLHWAAEAMEAPEPVDAVVAGVLNAGSVGVAFGAPGAKKTYAVGLDLGFHVAMGLDWLGHPTSQGPVLLIDEESGRNRMNRRLAETRRGLNAPKDIPFAYTSLVGFNLRDAAHVAKLTALVAEVKPRLVIIDALVDVAPGDENSTKDIQPVMQALRRIAEAYHCAVLLIHHSTKAGNGYRGSSAIAGAADLMLLVESKNGSTEITFSSDKNRDGEPFTFSAIATWTPDPIEPGLFTFRMARSASTKKLPHYSKSEQYVIDYLSEHGPANMADIMSHADRCSESTARQAVYALVGKKVVRRADGGGQGAIATFELVPRRDENRDPWDYEASDDDDDDSLV